MLSEALEEQEKHSGAVKRQEVDETLTFFEEDIAGAQYSYSDMIVVILNIDDYNVY